MDEMKMKVFASQTNGRFFVWSEKMCGSTYYKIKTTAPLASYTFITNKEKPCWDEVNNSVTPNVSICNVNIDKRGVPVRLSMHFSNGENIEVSLT